MAKNVLGNDLIDCSLVPLTGFFRDGCCNTSPEDLGQHSICCQMTADFLEFSKAAGNDLSTPRYEFNFPGLKPGDNWCVCLPRWVEAYNQGKAPKIILEACHISVLETVPLEILEQFAVKS